jgi:hypothetical protein
MSERPADVHIDDLANPILPPEIVAAQGPIEEMAAGLDWSVDGVLASATAESGLEDFGSDDFKSRLDLILRSLNDDHPLNAMGRVSRFALLVKFLKNRLLVEDLYNRHPEIEEVVFEPPILIAGLPRTGTTHLHNLISADPQIRSLPYWEALEPVSPVGEVTPPGGVDPRYTRAEAQCAQQEIVLPLFNRMHEMRADYVHEEIDLLAVDFSTMFFENLGIVEKWRDAYLASDQTPHYAYLKRILKALQWQRGPKRWILKSPQHLEQITPIMNVFPDATVVFTHRDPVSIVASLATMIAYGARLSDSAIDLPRYGNYWRDRVRDLLNACARDRDKVPAAQSMDIRFQDFVGQDMDRVRDIYALAEQSLSDASVDSMAAYAQANPQGVNGKVIYRLEDFGLDATSLREEFRDYTDRFDVRLER